MAFGISGKIHGKDPNFRGEGGQAGCDKIPTLTENPFAGLPLHGDGRRGSRRGGGQ